jgi:hypothetical protein
MLLWVEDSPACAVLLMWAWMPYSALWWLQMDDFSKPDKPNA